MLLVFVVVSALNSLESVAHSSLFTFELLPHFYRVNKSYGSEITSPLTWRSNVFDVRKTATGDESC